MNKPLTKEFIVDKLKQLRVRSHKKDFDVVNDSTLKDALIDLENKMPGAPRIVLLAGFNEAARPEPIKENLAQLLVDSQGEIMNINTKSATLEGNISYEFQSLRIATNNKITPELETENYIFLTCPRNPEIFLDYCKIADIICVVLSCKDADQSVKAFDDLGYIMLNAMKAQGIPSVVGILQDLETINESQQAAVKEVFQESLKSELGVDEKVIATSPHDPKAFMALMKVLQKVSLKQLEWREIRSYFLAEKLQVDPQNQLVEIEGFLKGNYFTPNQLVHITGYGDFPVLQVDILQNPFMSTENKQKLIEDLISAGFTPDGNTIVSFFAEESKMEDYSQFSDGDSRGGDELGFSKEEAKEGGFPNDSEDETEIEDEDSDISFEEKKAELSCDALQEERKQLRQLAQRDDDEVDFPPDVKAYERFMKYRGLTSFKTSPWDPYEGLPAEYERIFAFDNFSKSKESALERIRKETVVSNGFYIKIYVAGFPVDDLATREKNKPLVVSSLFPYERKINVLNLKVKSSDAINSKEIMEVHLGFRIYNTRPIFSKFIDGTSKTKYEKKTQKDQLYMASFYGEVTYPPANAVIFRTNENGIKEVAASGELMQPDPFKVIIKRVTFTGYPVKIHKRLAVVKTMFFNKTDVLFFKPVKLITKDGLKGFIKGPLGKHGCIKCVFNSSIKHNDTVCLNLYKRVFPKWPFEPVQQSNDGWN